MLSNGIVGNLFGPVNGRRHDSHVLARIWSVPVYSDSGYPLKKYLMIPFKGNLTRRENILNKKMSKFRVTVEGGYAKVLQLFPFVDFKKNLKVYKQEVGNYYKVTTILSEFFECDPAELEEYLGLYRFV